MQLTYIFDNLLIDALFSKDLPNVIKMFKLQIWTDFLLNVPDVVSSFNCPTSKKLAPKKLFHLLLAPKTSEYLLGNQNDYANYVFAKSFIGEFTLHEACG